MTSSRGRILVADADAPTRAGLRLTLAAERFEVVHEADSLSSSVAATRELRPDVVLVADELPGGWLAAVRTIVEVRRRTRVLVLSARPDEEELVAAVLAGAVGYFGKDVSLARLPYIIDGVIAGEVALPRHLSRRLLDELRGRDARRALVSQRASAPLSEREWEVLHLLAAGMSTAEIAHRLGISDVTVRRHVSSLLGKLGVSDRASAVRVFRSAD